MKIQNGPVCDVINRIEKYMSRVPHTVEVDDKISYALSIMSEHGFHHLPVMDGGNLVGVVTSAELCEVLLKRFIDPHNTAVHEVVNRSPLVLNSDDSLRGACAQMVQSKTDLVLVARNRDVIGILTLRDLARAFLDLDDDLNAHLSGVAIPRPGSE